MCISDESNHQVVFGAFGPSSEEIRTDFEKSLRKIVNDCAAQSCEPNHYVLIHRQRVITLNDLIKLARGKDDDLPFVIDLGVLGLDDQILQIGAIVSGLRCSSYSKTWGKVSGLGFGPFKLVGVVRPGGSDSQG